MALGIAVVACTALIITVPHRLGRLSCVGVTKPDPSMDCFQALHGLYALAAGGPFGSGLGAGVGPALALSVWHNRTRSGRLAQR